MLKKLTALACMTALLGAVACAKKESRFAGLELVRKVNKVPMQPEIKSFKGLANIAAESHGVKWSDIVAIAVRAPSMVRLDVIEKVTDVVATVVMNESGGSLTLPLEESVTNFGSGIVRLPKIGDVEINARVLAGILVGRPKIEDGFKEVSESFYTNRGSYFVRGAKEEMEVSSKEGMPLVYTRYLDTDKKRILFEADFDQFETVKGKKFPGHIVIRFEHPKIIIDIKYKDFMPDAVVPEGLFLK